MTVKEKVRCDCPYCLQPITEWTDVCPHCTRDIPNPSGIVDGNPMGDLIEVLIKLGMWTVGFAIAICVAISELNVRVPNGDWVLVLICFVAFILACLLYKRLPPKH